MEIFKDRIVIGPVTLTKEELKKALVEMEGRIFPFGLSIKDYNLCQFRGFKGISPQFLEIRSIGRYKEASFFLSSPIDDSIKWSIVEDENGAQVLIPTKDLEDK